MATAAKTLSDIDGGRLAIATLSLASPFFTSLDPISFPPKYYFTQFASALHLPGDKRSTFVTGKVGLDQDVPEMTGSAPYDPFKADVRVLGNMYRDQFLRVSRYTTNQPISY